MPTYSAGRSDGDHEHVWLTTDSGERCECGATRDDDEGEADG